MDTCEKPPHERQHLSVISSVSIASLLLPNGGFAQFYGVRGNTAIVQLLIFQQRGVSGDIKVLAFKSGGVVLNTRQVQVMVPPLCVLIHAVVMPLGGRRLITLPSAAKTHQKPSVWL